MKLLREKRQYEEACGLLQPMKYCHRKEETFSDLALKWLDVMKDNVKESTYTRYFRSVIQYLLPIIGTNQLKKIDRAAIGRLKCYLLTEGGKKHIGLSGKTVADILSILKQILLFAYDNGKIESIPAKILYPRRTKQDVMIIPEKIVLRMETALLQMRSRVATGILLTLHTGIRNGELCGLRWEDIDFQSDMLRIRRTVERISDLDPQTSHKTKIVIESPKTESSSRKIPLPAALCRYLEERREAQEFYILTGTDKPCEPHTLYARYRTFLKQNGFGQYTFHALRHTFATRGIEAGFDTKALSEILGHSDVATTLRCYIHPSIEQKRKQMEQLFNTEERNQKYHL